MKDVREADEARATRVLKASRPSYSVPEAVMSFWMGWGAAAW